MQPTRIITTNQIFGITKTNRLKRIAGITAGIMAALFAASCSSDAFFGFDDDLTNNYYDNYNQYWYTLGDLALTDIEWNGGIKQHAISEIGTNFESDSTIERGTIYYVKAVSYRNNPTYNFCFGDACVNFSINGEPCGFTDTNDFNARPWGERDGLAELVTRLVNIYGPYYGAEDYKIYYGII